MMAVFAQYGLLPIALTIGGHPGGSAAVVAYGVIGFGAVGNDPAHLRELAIGDVRQDLRLRDDHVVGPYRARAGEHAVDGLLLADVLDGVGPGPDGTGGGGVVAPGQSPGIEQVSQCGMLETGILGRRMVSLPAASIIATNVVRGAMQPASCPESGFSAAKSGLVAVGAEVPEMMNW